MADLGQDAASLRIKALEKEIAVDEKRLSMKRLTREAHFARARADECDRNIAAIAADVAAMEKDLASLQDAAAAAEGTQ